MIPNGHRNNRDSINLITVSITSTTMTHFKNTKTIIYVWVNTIKNIESQ